MTRPHVGLVAEDGPEAIIPLGSKRRGRGIELLHRAAAALGVPAPSGERYDVPQTPSNTVDTPAPKTPSSPASGGLVSLDGREDDEAPEDVPAFSPVVYPAPAPQAPAGAAAQPVSILVEIGLNPQFVIQGTAGMSPDEIIATVKSRIRVLIFSVRSTTANSRSNITEKAVAWKELDRTKAAP